MSSIIFSESSRMGSTTYAKRIVVTKEQPESLPDYVKRVRAMKGFSLLDVERKSREAGNQIAGSYVSRIENGIADADSITPKKLQALAFGLEVPEMEVIFVALGRSIPIDPLKKETERLATYYFELPREGQLDVLSLTEALWRRRRAQKKPPLRDNAREVAKPKENSPPRRRERRVS